DGSYVVASPGWSNSRGAATWADGTSGSTLDSLNTIDVSNSLLGAAANAGLQVLGTGPGAGTFVVNFSTENGGRLTVGVPLPSMLPFAGSADQTVTLAAAFVAKTLAAGTNVVLQANNDITVSSPIAVTPSGTAGSL